VTAGWPSFMDLQDRQHPAVQRALTRVCGLCGARKGHYCQGLAPGTSPVSVVHFSRAVTEADARKRREGKNAQLA
jgi:hypothetical protein